MRTSNLPEHCACAAKQHSAKTRFTHRRKEFNPPRFIESHFLRESQWHGERDTRGHITNASQNVLTPRHPSSEQEPFCCAFGKSYGPFKKPFCLNSVATLRPGCCSPGKGTRWQRCNIFFKLETGLQWWYNEQPLIGLWDSESLGLPKET